MRIGQWNLCLGKERWSGKAVSDGLRALESKSGQESISFESSDQQDFGLMRLTATNEAVVECCVTRS